MISPVWQSHMKALMYPVSFMPNVASGAITHRIHIPNNPHWEIGARKTRIHPANFRIVGQSLAQNWIRIRFLCFYAMLFIVHTWWYKKYWFLRKSKNMAWWQFCLAMWKKNSENFGQYVTPFAGLPCSNRTLKRRHIVQIALFHGELN